MKYAFAVLAGAAMAVAQNISSLNTCGQTCFNNMISIAQSQFGCAAGDISCYCTQPRFGYGLRDCSQEACGNAEYSSVLAAGTAYCASAGVSGTGAATAISTGAGNGTAISGGSSHPYTTSAIVTTISSGSKAITTSTIGSTTLFSSGSLSVSTSTVTSSSTATSSTAAGSSSGSGSGGSGSGSGGASSSSSSGFAPHITGAPILGGAALAALFFV